LNSCIGAAGAPGVALAAEGTFDACGTIVPTICTR
jgi:hypothetical protein